MGKATANTKADTAVKLVLIFFISLLSFTVGTYVGKQFSDSEAHRASLEVDYNSQGTETASVVSTEDSATAPISDEEVADLTEEFVKSERQVASQEESADDKIADEKKVSASADNDGYTHHSKMKAETVEAKTDSKMETAAKATATKEAVTPQPAADRVSKDKAPTPDMKKPREPSSVLPTVATTAIGKYTVQVASYATEAEAKTQAEVLKGKGYSAFFVPAEIKGKTWYRVSIGLFSDHKTATNYRTELLSTNAVPSAIVQKIVQ